MSAADKAVFVKEAAQARRSVWAAGSVLREIRAELGVGSGAEELSDPRVRERFFAEYQDDLSGLWEHLGESAKQHLWDIAVQRQELADVQHRFDQSYEEQLAAKAQAKAGGDGAGAGGDGVFVVELPAAGSVGAKAWEEVFIGAGEQGPEGVLWGRVKGGGLGGFGRSWDRGWGGGWGGRGGGRGGGGGGGGGGVGVFVVEWRGAGWGGAKAGGGVFMGAGEQGPEGFLWGRVKGADGG